MEKYTNEHGKECYKGVNSESKFSADLFHLPEWQPKEDDEYSKAFHSDLGSLTVLSRRTGYIGSPIDVESGYRDKDGKFWLASCGYDVSSMDFKTVGEAIQYVKDNANTCVPEA